MRDNAIKSLAHCWALNGGPKQWRQLFSQTARRQRQSRFLAQSGEVVGRGHPCLCKLRMQARKRGLIFFLGPQCKLSGLTPLNRYQMEWSLVPLSCELLKDLNSQVFLTPKAVEETEEDVSFSHAVCSYFPGRSTQGSEFLLMRGLVMLQTPHQLGDRVPSLFGYQSWPWFGRNGRDGDTLKNVSPI